MQTKNAFRKTSIFDKRKISKIDFNKGLKSIDHEELYFINFFSSKECKEYKLLSSYYKKAIHNDTSFLENEFYNNEYSIHNIAKNNRLKELIKETTDENLNDIDLLNIVKYKNKKNNGIQLFIKYNSEYDIGEIYLIDLYHMVIPTEDKRLKQKRHNIQNHYNVRKKKVKHNVNLQTIKYFEK